MVARSVEHLPTRRAEVRSTNEKALSIRGWVMEGTVGCDFIDQRVEVWPRDHTDLGRSNLLVRE